MLKKGDTRNRTCVSFSYCVWMKIIVKFNIEIFRKFCYNNYETETKVKRNQNAEVYNKRKR